MTEINVDGEDAGNGLMALVVTVVDLLVETLEREAVRRMESGALSDEEIERLGAQLAAIEREIDRLIDEQGLEDDVDALRGDLNALVSDAIERADEEGRSVGMTGGKR